VFATISGIPVLNSFTYQETQPMNSTNLTRIILDQQSYGYNEYIPEVPCIRHQATGFKTSSEVRACLNLILAYVIEKKQVHDSIGILFDFRDGEPATDDDLKWIGTEWQPKVTEIGVRYIAMVFSNHPLAELNADIVSDDHEHDHKLTKRLFCNHDAALAWLNEVANQ